MSTFPPERWAEVDALLDRLLERPAGERAAWLERECGDDDALLAHARRLLRAVEEPTPVLDRSVQDAAPDVLRGVAEEGLSRRTRPASDHRSRGARDDRSGGDRGDPSGGGHGERSGGGHGERSGGARGARFADSRAGLGGDSADVPDHLRPGGSVPDRAGDPFDPEGLEDPLADFPDGRVGPYRVVRELGRGGMGVVYLAERADGQYEGTVALKVVKRGLDTDEVLRRFLQERQILAGLHHPHIARLLDGGVAPGDRPFLVMDHVEGLPLTTYCEEKALSPDARLELFAAVCEAVHHAHRNLVVHRDLKPSNILVDDTGHVTLLDFGIAKLLRDDGDSGKTRLGFLPMSPDYASPEQVRGEPVTTATDVYALGVVLYELLAGERPYRFERPTPAAIERALLRPPTPPSEVARRAGRRRDARRLRGDLETIVLRAMATEPERRYGSAEALLADLRRERAGLPIAAQRDRAAYRARKFFGRHRIGTAFAGSLAGLGVTFGAFHSARVSAERDAALLAAAKAEQVTAFMVDMFRSSEPDAAGADALTLDDVLGIGARRIQEELRDQPEVRAAMMSAMGGVYLNLGRFEDARRLYEGSLTTRREAAEPDPRGEAESLLDLGTVLHRQGDFERADSALLAALAILDAGRDRRAGGDRRERHPEAVASVLSRLVEVRFAQGRYPEADSLGRLALELRTSTLDPTDPLLAMSHASLGMVARRMDRHEVAEHHQREALRIRRERYGDVHSLVALSTKDVALTLHSQGRLEEAEPLYRQALATQRALFGDTHPELSTTMNSLASLLGSLGRFEESEAMHRETLAMRRQLYGPDHPRVAGSMVNLANTLGDLGKLEESVAAYEAALDIYRARFGDRHPSVATTLNGLAVSAAAAGDPARAYPLFEEAEALYVDALGPDHSWVAVVLLNHGDARLAGGEHAFADSLFERALAIQRQAFPGPHAYTARVLTGLGRARLAAGRTADAEPLLREALAMSREAAGEAVWLEVARAALGECLLRLGRRGEGEALLRESLEGLGALSDFRGERERARVEALVRELGV